MTKKEILNYLELITDELTDAYHLTDTDGTVDANYSVSPAQELVEALHHNIENNINIFDFCNYFIYYINIEQQHSLFQCSKILNWMDLTYNNLINNKESYNYSENTNVFTYYILKTILLSNLNDFIRFCTENNSKLLNFNNTPKNIKLFNSFLIKHIKSNKSKKIFNNYFHLYMNTETNNFYFNKSLRMTIIEFI